jgi:hypothetical protein
MAGGRASLMLRRMKDVALGCIALLASSCATRRPVVGSLG